MSIEPTANNENNTSIVTGIVRGTFLNLFVPKSINNVGDAKYFMTLLISKSDTATIEKIRIAQEAAVQKRWANHRPEIIHTTLHDGDGIRLSTGKPFGPECKGNFVMSVSSKSKPGLVDRDRNHISDSKQVKNGDYFRVSLSAYAYDWSGNSGVTFMLNNVQHIRKGDSLASYRSRAEDDFKDDALLV